MCDLELFPKSDNGGILKVWFNIFYKGTYVATHKTKLIN